MVLSEFKAMRHLHLYILTANRYTSDAASIVIAFDSPCAASILDKQRVLTPGHQG